MLVLDFVFSQDGQTALAIAAREGHVEIVQDLLSKGAYVNVGDRVSNLLLWPTSHLHMYNYVSEGSGQELVSTQNFSIVTGLGGLEVEKKQPFLNEEIGNFELLYFILLLGLELKKKWNPCWAITLCGRD